MRLDFESGVSPVPGRPLRSRLLPLLAFALVLPAQATTGVQTTWPTPDKVDRGGAEADLIVQLGDVDNLGFGWPDGFDPFSGRSTNPHAYPWSHQPTDAPGTDRIMVISGYTGRTPNGDGYSSQTERRDNRPVPLRLAFDTTGLQIRSAALQLFVDDFQAPTWGTRFRVRLDDREAPDVAAVVNRLDQTGPIGKLLTVQLLPEYLPLLTDGRLEIVIDDPTSDVGDGFAFDFVRLLINLKAWKYTGTISGVATVAGEGRPLEGVLVSAGNVRQATTGKDGRFELRDVPAGLAMTTGRRAGYLPDSEAVDLVAGESAEVTLELSPNRETKDSVARELDRTGKADLYGIYFDADRATLKPESEATLAQVLALLGDRATLRLVVVGHTDAEGSEAHNQELSERRARAVVAWLTARQIRADRLEAIGVGESQPVADNGSPQGRALNRRVEIRESAR
jgi:outer membrane protein OmpA-like peptidoglycan-associated protein